MWMEPPKQEMKMMFQWFCQDIFRQVANILFMLKQKPFDTSASPPSEWATLHIYPEFLGAMAIAFGLTLSRKDLGLSPFSLKWDALVWQCSFNYLQDSMWTHKPERKKRKVSLLVMDWQLVSLLCYYFKKRNANPKGGKETDGPILNCHSPLFRPFSTSMMCCLWTVEWANKLDKLKACSPISVG